MSLTTQAFSALGWFVIALIFSPLVWLEKQPYARAYCVLSCTKEARSNEVTSEAHFGGQCVGQKWSCYFSEGLE